MPQIQIKDALGNVQTAATVSNTGRAAETDSMPVVLQNEDNSVLQSIDAKATNIGTVADVAATTDAGSFSILAFIKRAMANWTALLAKLPALVGNRVPVDASGVELTTTDTKNGTRVYDFDNNSRVVVTSTSTAATPLPPLYGSREAMFHAKERTFLRIGTSGVAPATDGDKQLILEAGERFHFRIPAGVTHYRAIRETTDGVVTITAVVS